MISPCINRGHGHHAVVCRRVAHPVDGIVTGRRHQSHVPRQSILDGIAHQRTVSIGSQAHVDHLRPLIHRPDDGLRQSKRVSLALRIQNRKA